jgi:acetyl/propionyl-CoA carboxylase alpha subunit
MAKVLANTACVGVKTNQLFMQACLLNKGFRDPAYTTSFIPTHIGELLRSPWSQSLPEAEKVLSVIPSIIARRLPEYIPSTSHRKPFGNIRKQFRNQRYDPVSVQCDIVTRLSWPQTASSKGDGLSKFMCVWKPQDTASSSGRDEAYLFPVPDAAESQEKANSAAMKVSAQYNSISQALRTGDVLSASPHVVKIGLWRPAEGNPALTGSWLTSTLELSIDGAKILAHVALPSVQPYALAGQIDRSQRVFCHLPSLGTHVEFKRDTLLSFAESTRAMAKEKDGPEQKTVTAPMPCKVLSVLKRNGDEVKSGETVMVIESMKMEVSIAVAASGKFESDWKTGDAVEEGRVLCSVV